MKHAERITRLKLIVTTFTLTIIGATLIAISKAINAGSDWQLIPFSEIGGILIGAGLLSIWLDHLFRADQAEADEARLRRIMADHAPLMRDAVLNAFAANHPDLKRVATPETLDRITTTSLGLRLHDREFADDIYDDLKASVINAPERWHDAQVDITLTKPTSKELSEYFIATIRCEYTVQPHHQVRRFICLSDRQEYNSLSRDDGSFIWFLKPTSGFTANQRQAFELVSLSVDGEPRPIKRSSRKHYQAYSANLDTDPLDAKPVRIAYTFTTITRQAGHLLFYSVDQPTRGLEISLDYTDTDIATVSAVDLFGSSETTITERSPDNVPPRTIRTEVQGWAMPNSGAAFVWTLEAELAAQDHNEDANKYSTHG